MRDTCTFDYAITIPETINYVSSDCCLYERLEYEEAHLVGYDVVSSDCVLSQHFGFHSAVCDIFSGLFALASCISLRFVHFIGDLVFKDVHSLSEDLLASSSGQHPGCPCHDCMLSSEGSSPSSKNNDGTGSVISEVVLDLTEEVPLHTRTEIVECRKPGLCFIFRGLMFSLFGLRIAWRLGVAAWRYSFCYVRCAQLEVRRIIYRVQKTLRGSSGDIGWLQNATGMPSVEDGTTRFLELLQGIRNGLHMLPNSFVYLLIPGLFSNHGPLYFVSTKKFFSKMGLACHIAKIHSEASVEHNAWELKQYIEELYWGSGKCVMLLGHSKGGVDAAAALSLYWSDLKGKVAGLAVVQSPYGGTPIASDILREGQIGYRETRRIMELLICKFIKGDIRALEDLTYDKRREFLTRHTLPEDIPLISFHSEASIAPGVLATMAHIAHAELPWLPFPSFRNDDFDASVTVPVVVPLSALMALSALHLQLRYGEKSDGVVTCRDAEIPGSVVVRPDRKLDHAWMVYSTQRKSRNEPDASEMCEAILTLLVELGRMEL